MKMLKVAKFQVSDTLKAVGIYYAIFILVISFFAWLNANSKGSVTSSGLEVSSVIFILVVGLNSFKDSFKFSQANNISRKTFFRGIVMGMVPITMGMSTIDLIINRVYNIFVPSPTNFDMIYGSFRDTGMRNMVSNTIIWVQSNNISTLFGTITWQFFVYSSFFLLGVLISLIYYRSNKLLKIIVSVIPVILIISGAIQNILPASFWERLKKFIPVAFGWQSRNPYIAELSFAVCASIFVGFAYLLIRKAVAKE